MNGQLSVLLPTGTATLDRTAPPVIAPVIVDDQEELKRVAGFLTDEIDDGLVKVYQDANTITVRLAGAGMFPSGSDQVKPEFATALGRVADALNETTGPVILAGHADNIAPGRGGRFPNNMALSLARAEAVSAMIAPKVKDPTRLKPEGRSDREPIATNDTSAGRAENRRIEILLVRTGVQQ